MTHLKQALLCLLLTGMTGTALAQTEEFPYSWSGNWKGELQWFKGNAREPQRVPMELRIAATDTAGWYTWQLIYGAAAEDNRPYLLMSKDTATGHWVIDERNGIILDQFIRGGRFCGVFTVMGNTILNSYTREGDTMTVEFYSYTAKPIATTGEGTDDSPKVDSYRIGGFQKAVLHRSH